MCYIGWFFRVIVSEFMLRKKGWVYVVMDCSLGVVLLFLVLYLLWVYVMILSCFFDVMILV